jgi:hypothetical protein
VLDMHVPVDKIQLFSQTDGASLRGELASA